MIETRRGFLAGAVFTLLLAIGGCAPVRASGSSPTATSTIVFNSRDEALGAARKAYLQYLSAGDAITETGGEGVIRLRVLMSKRQYQDEVESYRGFARLKVHTKGPSRLAAFKLQQADLRSGSLSAYACVDISQVHVINQAGIDVTPKGGEVRTTYRPSFKTTGSGLILDKDEAWSGSSVC